ncbi:hypothetical protein DFA_07787 [Cavenderia fasciculata]|uniref:Response regulatory domain-containing protein n=1 Tax=Cavenderia fasciculata TaxID=261658 RepID=F4Q3E0_CACFS|nr:uncharacterized protein DFA_07787 [Cavenderia fasciculata]EGG16809.1 hypothetical protein DFA_07787 [Cavenderia fasciculata]|eukprot:XP_004355283.1 hypothetical protein DFA_07787 [Cavenderia fasciculata]
MSKIMEGIDNNNNENKHLKHYLDNSGGGSGGSSGGYGEDEEESLHRQKRRKSHVFGEEQDDNDSIIIPPLVNNNNNNNQQQQASSVLLQQLPDNQINNNNTSSSSNTNNNNIPKNGLNSSSPNHSPTSNGNNNSNNNNNNNNKVSEEDILGTIASLNKNRSQSVVQKLVDLTFDYIVKNIHSIDTLKKLPENLTDTQCVPLVHLTNLTHLSVSGNPDLTDAFLAHLKHCPLVELNLSYNENISEHGFQMLREQSDTIHTTLTSLSLNNCAVNDEMMNHIGKLLQLTSLSLINNPFSDSGAKHLSNLQSLTSLDLSMCKEISDVTLESLQALSQISRLNLNFNPKLTSNGMSKFLNLSHLTSLGIIGCDGLLIKGKVKHRPLVLLVEDNPFQVKLITRIFTRHNFEVEVASNGRMAVEMYKNANYKYELILMDIIMPIMDGLTATMLLRDFERENGLRRVPVIIQTADMERHRKVCLAAGCDDFMLKPLDRNVIDRAREFLTSKS